MPCLLVAQVYLEDARAHFLAAAARLRLRRCPHRGVRARRGQPLREYKARQGQKMLGAQLQLPVALARFSAHAIMTTIEDNTIVSKRACIYEAGFGPKTGAVSLVLAVLLLVLDFTCAPETAYRVA